MTRIDWTERAIADFEAAIAYIAEENPINAQLVRDRILNTLKHLESFSLGVEGSKGSFKLYIPKTSYFALFRRNAEGDVSLRAFLHTSRDWGKFDWDEIV